jgi:hypothetical protein
LPIKYLPSVTLGKVFAKCKIAFAENAIPVVIRLSRNYEVIVIPFLKKLDKLFIFYIYIINYGSTQKLELELRIITSIS